MDNSINNTYSNFPEVVGDCIKDVRKYFHPEDKVLMKRFNWIYNFFNLNDEKVSREIGIHKSTMSRYRRGIFVPSTQMKILIAKAISKLINYSLDTSQIWGEDLIFINWREKTKKEPEEKSSDLNNSEINEGDENGEKNI